MSIHLLLISDFFSFNVKGVLKKWACMCLQNKTKKRKAENEQVMSSIIYKAPWEYIALV